MTFLHFGLAAAGLACVSIPIIIHLLMRRRRKPVMWGAMRFLLEAYQKHRRRLLLEKWLLLLSRCALIALIGLAIGRPLLGALGGVGAGGRTVYILLDNGIASGVVGQDGRTALDRNRDKAKAVLGALGSGAGSEGDRAALVYLGGPAEPVVLPPSSDIHAVTALIDAATPTDSKTDLTGGFAAVADAIRAEQAGGGARAGGRAFVAVLSDFLDGSADLTSTVPKLPEGTRLLTTGPAEAVSNVAITGVEPLRSVVVTGRATDAAPGAAPSPSAAGEQVRVTLRRTGPIVGRAGSTEISLALVRPNADGAGGSSSAASVPQRGDATATIHWRPGEETASASAQVTGPGSGPRQTGEGSEVLEARIRPTGPEDDALTLDNLWRRTIEIRDALRVGVVAPLRFGARERADRLDPGEWLRLALHPGESAGIDVVEIEPVSLDSARLAGLDALVLPRPDLVPEAAWARVRLFLDGGGLLLVTPPAGVTVHVWPDAMIRSLGLPWKLAREATVFGANDAPPQSIVPGPRGAASSESDSSPARSVLALIEGELGDLTRPVSVRKALPMQGEQESGSRLLTLANGATFLWAGAPSLQEPTRDAATGVTPPPDPGAAAPAPPTPRKAASEGDRGLVVYLASALDLDWTDLPAKPLMVPLVQEIIKQGVGRARGSFSAIAGSRLAVPARTVELRAQSPRSEAGAKGDETGGPVVIPVDESGTTTTPLRRAGLWRAVDERGGSRGLLAVNPDVRGSRTQAQERAQVEQWLAGAAPDGQVVRLDEQAPVPEGAGGRAIGAAAMSALTRQAEKSPISFPLLIGAAALALFELWLARRASHAEAAGASVRGAPAPGLSARTEAA